MTIDDSVSVPPRARMPVLCALLLTVGCGPSAAVHAIPQSSGTVSPAPEGACELTGTWTSDSLLSPQAGFEYATLTGVPFQARITRMGGELRIQAMVRARGWSLGGRISELHTREAVWLTDGVGVAPGAHVTVSDARPGEVQIGLSRFAPGHDDDHIRFLTPPRRWVPCAALGMEFIFRDDGTPARERAALGLPSDRPTQMLAEGTSASLSLQPGGAPFVELGPVDHAETLSVLETRDGLSRVLLHHWTGTAVVGWLATDALSPVTGGGGLGLLGTTEGSATEVICTSPEPLVIAASRDDSAEEAVGSVEPGTPFRRLATRDDAVSIAPVRGAPVIVHHDVVWWVRPRAPLRCSESPVTPAT